MFRGVFFYTLRMETIMKGVFMDEKKVLKKLSAVGILGNIFLSAFKLVAGILGKSGAMVSDAVHTQ